MNIDITGDAYAAAVAARLGKLTSRPLTAATVQDLELIIATGLDIARCAASEQRERNRRGRLRLVANGGELTPAGARHLRARDAARARWGRSA